MSEKKIFINPQAPSVATALISGFGGNPTNFPELFFGDAYDFVVKFTGDSDDGFIVPPADSFVFNLGLLARASAGTFVLEFDGLQTQPLPFDASAEDVANALNELETMQNVGGCEVTGLGGSPYRIIFKNYGGRSKIGIQSSLFPDVAPISYVVEAGSPDARAEQLIILKLDYVASVTDYTIDANAKELRFKVSLNTVECLLALGQADKVKLIAELKGISATGEVQTFVQVPATIYNRLIDVSALEYTIVELAGVVAQANAILEQFRSESAGITESIKTLSQVKSNRGELHFNGGSLACSQKWTTTGAFSVVFTMAIDVANIPASAKDWIGTATNSQNYRGMLLSYDQKNIRLYLIWSDSAGSRQMLSRTITNANYYDGKPHIWCYSFTGDKLKLLIDDTFSVEYPIIDCSEIQHTSPFAFKTSTQVVSRVKAFNFDITSADAPYTLADYVAGKDEPPNTALLSLADYSIQRNSTTKVVLDESGNGNVATITGDVVGTKDSAISAFIDELKMQITQTS